MSERIDWAAHNARVRAAARDRWPEILHALAGLDDRQLSGRHGPCPSCGGEDRYRFDDLNGEGSYFCNGCGPGDGIGLLMKCTGWSFAQAAAEVGRFLRIDPPEKHAQAKPQATTGTAVKRRRATEAWDKATPEGGQHRYLVDKGIQPHGVRSDGVRLVVPMRDTAGVIHDVQTIGPDGSKRCLPGPRPPGLYFGIGRPDTVLCIAEGFATGASIHEATGHAVAVTFGADNLKAASEALRAKFPDVQLILCADDDHRKAGNPGITKATAAACAVGGLIAAPVFGPDRPDDATDFNDLARLCGADAVREAIEAAREPDAAALATVDALHPGVILTRADTITPEPIKWLWNGWLAAGKFHVYGGPPGSGKTTVATAIAATLTTGGRWPDGTQAPTGSVVIWSGEDDPADTLVPRLILAGADLSRVHIVSGTRAADGVRSFDPARDMQILERDISHVGDVRLLIVDPVVSAVAGDSHKNAETRRALQPLVDLGAALKCAVLGITHLTKGTGGRDPTERITGSLAFGALARVVLIAARHREEGEDGRAARLFLRAKSNIGPDEGGFEYELLQAEAPNHPGVAGSVAVWGRPVEGNARELLAMAEASADDEVINAIDEARRFLSDLLASGPVPAKTVEAEAADAGHSRSTIRRAKKTLGIVSEKSEMNGGWQWKMPSCATYRAPKMLTEPEDAQQKVVGTFDKSEHLRQTDDVRRVLI